MKPPYLIVDGYNLMHAAGIARKSYGPGDLDRCRGQLNRRLLDLLSAAAIARTIIVYDAFQSVSDQQRTQRMNGLTIVYAPKGTDADSEIERMLLEHSSPRQVIVVSSDHRLHKAARRRKASCVDSETFLRDLEDHDSESTAGYGHRSTSAKARETAVMTSEELDELTASIEQMPATESSNADQAFDDNYLRKLSQELDDGSFN